MRPIVTLLCLSLFIIPLTARSATPCDSLATIDSLYTAAYPGGFELGSLTDTLDSYFGSQHYDSASAQYIINTDTYWLTAIQGCGYSCPPIVSCTVVSALMDSFGVRYPQFDSASPSLIWVDYLNEHHAGMDGSGNTWTYQPAQWLALFSCCGVTAPAPVALGSYCDTIHTILDYIPGIGTTSVNPDDITDAMDNNLGYTRYDTASAQYVHNTLSYWLLQLRSCGDSCPQILSCDSIDAYIRELASYTLADTIVTACSVPFAEAYLSLRTGLNLDTAAWGLILSCCHPPGVDLDDTTFSYCEQAEYMRILLQYSLPGHTCLPA